MNLSIHILSLCLRKLVVMQCRNSFRSFKDKCSLKYTFGTPQPTTTSFPLALITSMHDVYRSFNAHTNTLQTRVGAVVHQEGNAQFQQSDTAGTFACTRQTVSRSVR